MKWGHDYAPAKIVTVGYVVEDTNEYILLAQSYNEQERTYGNLIRIPKAVLYSLLYEYSVLS